ncbi:subtilisin-like serine protease [Xenococcus sp. PCC 7305]|uniref:S8 family peptidase n=1 Tax=Xenococcus sp. PCC 7305 TaxID=102125 RepID=UPI0002ABDBE3|nr:S8 family peptidase [Xenococcus sp. PCC 7305]ELS03684.1 subtilisin-like serine protease [Xenococcus sp. PCC 7305]
MKKILLLGLFIIGLGFALTNFQGLAVEGEFNSIILDFREDVPMVEISNRIQAINQKYSRQGNLNSIFSVADHVYVVPGQQPLLDALLRSPVAKDTEYIEPNYEYSILEVPNDPEYRKQWNFRSINVEGAWDQTKGEGVTIAVIDTGVSRVPDLKLTKFVKGYDFVNDLENPEDDQGHGTHVAGIIAQSTNNGYGVAGIANLASIMPLKVLSADGVGTVANIAEAIKFAADNNADIINLSLGGGGASRLLEEAIAYAYDKGVVIVAAAGNENLNAASYPARYPKVIGVAATDLAGEKTPYSNYGAGVDIAAPGGTEDNTILQNTINPSTGESVFVGFQGTSMAAPHVAGVAALVKASGIETPEEIIGVIKSSARKAPEDTFNYFGAGLLDAQAAVNLAVQGEFSFRDFFRWLRDNGYLNPIFWIDGGTVALLPKLGMVIGSYLLAWILRSYLSFNLALNSGLIFGSSGLFLLQGFYVFDLPQWPFRLMGSSLPELGNLVMGTTELNPFFASVLIPFALVAILAGHKTLKWFAIGICLGVAACLGISAMVDPAVWGLGDGAIARSFLGINAFCALGLGYLASQKEK